MIIWTLLFIFLVDSAIGNPEPGLGDDGKYGYEYDVRHPGGSSRVHVSSGSEHNRGYYPNNPSGFHHGDYISDSSYNDPLYVGSTYRPNRPSEYPRNYNHGPACDHTPYSKVPVYEERGYPRSPVYRRETSHGHFPTYSRGHYGTQPGVISQSNFDAGSLYQKPLDKYYPRPHFVQQVSVDEPIPVKFEQVSLEPTVQKTLETDFSGPSIYPISAKAPTPSYSRNEQVPIDQQVQIDEQSPIDQKVLIEEQSPIDQQVLVDEPAPIVQQVLVEKQTPIDQQVVVDEPAPIVQQVLIEKQTPIDQQVLVDEQSPIDQKVLVEEQAPIDQKILVDKPSPVDQQVIVDEQSPIDQKVLVDKQSPIDQQVLVDEQSPLDQQIVVDEPKEIILQKPLYEKPELSQISDVPSVKSTPKTKGTPLIQQSSLDIIPLTKVNKPSVYVAKQPPIVQQVADVDPYPFTKKSPLIQKIIEHPSQAAYDSPIEPSFSDVDRHAPVQSYKSPPRYRYVPVGPPYEKISHFTKIIHAPPRPYYSPRPFYPPRGYPQKHIKTNFPVYKKPPLSYSIKYPPPPPITKTVLPVNSPYSQKTVNANIYTKNPPILQSVKAPPPPPPITKTYVSPALSGVQYHVDEDSIKNPPIYQSVKAPPPAPVTKTVKAPVLSQVQEHVDVVLTKNPPSVKLPPPAPITKTVVAAPVYQSIKLPPPPVTKSVATVKLPPPPVTKSVATVKLPPPPVTKSVPSVKLPPPPVTKSIAAVKLPPPPVTKSVASVKLPPPPVTKSVPSVKLPPPPVTKSVIQPQKNIDDDIVSKTYPPISQSVKTAPISQTYVLQEQQPVDIPSTKNAPLSVKYPPITVQVPQPVTYEKPSYVKEPFYGQKSIGSSQPKLPSVVSYFNKPQYTDLTQPDPYTVKNPYSNFPILPNKNTHYSGSASHLYIPSTKTSTTSHGVKQPVVGNSYVKQPVVGNSYVKQPVVGNSYSVKQPVKSVVAPNAKTPHVNPHFALLSAGDKGTDSYPAPKQSHSSPPEYEPTDINYPEDGPVKKYTPDFDDGPHPDSIHEEEEYGSNLPPSSHDLDEPVEEKSVFDKYPPVSHSIRLPSTIPKVESPSTDKLSEDGIGESSPFDKYPRVSHSVVLPTLPKEKPVPDLFAAVPDGPKSEALINPASHSVRLPLPIQGNNYKTLEKADDPKQKFPDFPVESALNQPDPVADKVAELSNSFTPGSGYDNSNPDISGPSDGPSIEEARAEIDRLNREIGRPFGSRLTRSSGFTRIR